MDHLDTQFDNDGTSFAAIFQKQQQQHQEEEQLRQQQQQQQHGLYTGSSSSSPPPSSTSPTSAFRSSPSPPSHDKQLSATTTVDSPSPSFGVHNKQTGGGGGGGGGGGDDASGGGDLSSHDEGPTTKLSSGDGKNSSSSNNNHAVSMFSAASDMSGMLSVDGGQSHQIHPAPNQQPLRHNSVPMVGASMHAGQNHPRGGSGGGGGIGAVGALTDAAAPKSGTGAGPSTRQLSSFSSASSSNPASPSMRPPNSAAAAAATTDFFNATLNSSPSPHRGSPLGPHSAAVAAAAAAAAAAGSGGAMSMNSTVGSPEDMPRQSPTQVKAEAHSSPFLTPASSTQTPSMNRRLPERSDSYQSLSGEMNGMNMGNEQVHVVPSQSMRTSNAYLGGMAAPGPGHGMGDYTMMSMDSPHSMMHGGGGGGGGSGSNNDNKRSNSDSGAGGGASSSGANNNNQADNGQGAASTKFVHKLFRMVSDPEYQHLISWNASGTSVVVTNFDEFAKEVLGKHFKHSNFSSFIRQLNMYGFYKVNKTPRGHRHAVDTQIWEFSHPKFIRGRPELLDDIRRKALDSEHARVEARDLQYSVSVGHMQLRQVVDEQQYRIEELYEVNMALRQVVIGLRDNVAGILEWIKMNNGGQLPFDAKLQQDMPPTPMIPSFSGVGPQGAASQGWGGMDTSQTADGPPIFVTEPAYGNPHGGGPMGHGPAGGDVFSFGAMSQVSPMGSRRVSAGSAQSEAMVQHHSPLIDEQGRPISAHSSNAGRSSFGDPSMVGRPIAGSNKAAASGLAIDTSLHHHAQFGVMPHGSNLSPNPGLGVMGPGGLPHSPISPQNAAMMAAAINTPLPPSPAVNAHMNGNPLVSGQFNPMDHGQGSPFMQTNPGGGMHSPSIPGGFPGQFGAAAYATGGNGGPGDVFSTSAMANDEDDGMLGPNSKASRTPLKRTASNSGGQSGQQHIQQQQAAAASANQKRKSPS